jgi:predicted nucleic acid-binding protein
MTMRLLDTDVMVDVLRAYPPAIEWLSSLTGDAPGLPGLVVLELMDGCRNKMEMMRLLKRIELFHVFWPTDSDGTRALHDFARSRLSHRISIMDVLIAQCPIGLNATLCTFNTKHFKAIATLRTEQPYAKK